MDKILWPHIKNKSVLSINPLKVVVIVRSPKNVIPSILSRNLDSIQNPDEALRYYASAIHRLEIELNTYDRPYVFLTYSDLINKTDLVLSNVTEYLELDEELSPEYSLIWSTGKKGIGDNTPAIYEKKISQIKENYNFDIPNYIIDEALSHYNNFLEKFNV
jgi:hypothetical protein